MNTEGSQRLADANFGPHILSESAIHRGFGDGDFYNSLSPKNEGGVIQALESSIYRTTRAMEAQLRTVFEESAGDPVAEIAEARIEEIMRNMELLIPPLPPMFTVRALSYSQMMSELRDRQSGNRQRRANNNVTSASVVLGALAEHQVPTQISAGGRHDSERQSERLPYFDRPGRKRKTGVYRGEPPTSVRSCYSSTS